MANRSQSVWVHAELDHSPATKGSARAYLFERIFYLAFAAVLGFFSLQSVDLFADLNAGARILERGWFFDHPFRFVATDTPRVLDHWLYQVAISLAAQWFGLSGLVMLRLLLVMALAVVIVRAAGAGVSFHPGWILVSMALLAIHPWFEFKSALVSLLFVALTVNWALSPKPWRPSVPVMIFVVQLIWTNSDRWYLLGPLLWAAVVVGRLLAADRATGAKVAGIHLVAALTGCLLHPNGLDAVTWAWHSLWEESHPASIAAVATQPSFTTDQLAVRVLVAACVVVVPFRLVKMAKDGAMMVLLLWLLWLYGNLPLAFVMLALAPWLAAETCRLVRMFRLEQVQVSGLFRAVGVLFLMIPGIWHLSGRATLTNRSIRSFELGVNSFSVPATEVEFLRNQNTVAGIACPIEWGGYVQYELKPERGVLIDRNAQGPAEFVEQVIELYAGYLDPMTYQESWGIGAFLVRWSDPLAARLWQNRAYTPVSAGRLGLVFQLAAGATEELDLRRSVRRQWLPNVGPETRHTSSLYPQALVDAGVFFLRLGEFQMVERLLHQLSSRLQSLPEFITMRALVLDAEEQRQEALALLDAVLSDHPRNAFARIHRANLLAANREPELALADIEVATAERPFDASLWLRRSELSRDLGRTRDAVEQLRKAADCAPHALEFVVPLIRLLADSAFDEERREASSRLKNLIEQLPEAAATREIENLRALVELREGGPPGES